MAVGVVMEFKGSTLEQYDQVIEKMGYEAGEAGAPGGIFHWVAEIDDGIRITDVWESAAEFESFGAEKLGPITAEVGIPAPPEISFFEVHNYLTAG